MTEEDEIKDSLAKIAIRIEDVELKQLELDEPIKALTPSDDLEDVKRALNHVIKTLNKVAI